MGKYTKKGIFFICIVLQMILLSGCTMQYGDGLLALPSLPSEYVGLQSKIDEVLATGATSAAAETGSNRQSIQLVDLDGDGDTETIAYFRKDNGNYLIKVYENEQDEYSEIGSAEAVGLTLHSIYYPLSSATGQRCIAVCWGIDEGSNYGMTVYSFDNGQMQEVLTIQYSGILVGDFTGNYLDELCFTIKDQVTGRLSLRIYAVKGKSYELDSEALLCAEARTVLQMSLGFHAEGKRGIFLDSSAYGGGYVSDVIVRDEETGKAKNISRKRDGETGLRTWRAVEVFCSDIDNDGITEVPSAFSLMSSIYADERNKISWTECREQGFVTKKKTYYMANDGWYMDWIDNWGDTVVAQTSRYSRMTKTVFFSLPDEMTITTVPTPNDDNTIMTIYIFSGDNKTAYLSVYGATQLVQKDGYVYAFALNDGVPPRFYVSDQEIIDAFETIESGWTMEVY